jgi:tetratricopeptide (TPR) repeat protein
MGLAHYYGVASATGAKPPNENWPRSEEAVNKALALDDSVAETYNVVTGTQLYYHRDWVAAEQSLRHGLQLNPDSVEVNHHYARCLLLFGRNDEAVAEMKRTVELEPLSLRYNLNLATLFFFVRQYDNAIDQLRKTLELDANYGPAHEWLGNAYEQKGMHKEAVAEWVIALKSRGQNELASTLEHNYATSGFDSVVRALGQQLLDEANEESKRGQYVAPAKYVLAYTRLGNKEEALNWLDKAVDVPDRLALEFKVNPLFDKLRGEPRFQAALQRIVVKQ